MKPVDRYSFGYELARQWVRMTFRGLFYKKWKIRGLENIDFSKPVLFAPNHQNALMDALHLVLISKSQPIFLARADIFKKKPIARILNWMKIIPVYRIRDGYESLSKNDEVFEKCARILRKGRNMIIFPEGNHGDQRNLRMLKKGLARVAFGAEKATDFTLGLQVVPVGIDYSHYENFRASVSVRIGKPILVNQFKEEFDEDVQKGYKALNAKIRQEIEPVMIEIPWKNLYDGVMGSRSLFGAKFAQNRKLPYGTLFERFDADKELIKAIAEENDKSPERIEKMCKKTATYTKLLKRNKLREHIPAQAPYPTLKLLIDCILLLIGIPFFIYGLVFNAIAFFVPAKLSKSLIKDPQFRSSVAYVLGMVVLGPLTYILLILASWLIFHAWILTVVYALSLVPLGLFAIHYSFFFKKTMARWMFSRQMRKKNPSLHKLLEMRKGLLKEWNELIA